MTDKALERTIRWTRPVIGTRTMFDSKYPTLTENILRAFKRPCDGHQLEQSRQCWPRLARCRDGYRRREVVLIYCVGSRRYCTHIIPDTILRLPNINVSTGLERGAIVANSTVVGVYRNKMQDSLRQITADCHVQFWTTLSLNGCAPDALQHAGKGTNDFSFEVALYRGL